MASIGYGSSLLTKIGTFPDLTMDQVEPLYYYRSPQHRRFMTLGFTGAIVACQWMLWSSLGTPQQTDGVGVGVVGTLIFGLFLIVLLREWISGRPYMTLDSAGIHVPYSGIGVFRWEDIREIGRKYIGPLGLHEAVVLHLHNYPEYFEQLRGIRRFTTKANHALGDHNISFL